MRLILPRSLHYPITVTELLKQPNDNVERFAPLFSYFYKTVVTEGRDMEQVEKSFPARFESPVEGVLTAWKIRKGLVIHSSIEIAEIEEPCAHPTQYGGMCVDCGKDMTEITYNTQAEFGPATVKMVHDNQDLRVTEDEASRLDEELKRRLLQSRRLSLVVDLDQTIIHATVDATVGKWQEDPENPNYEAVKHVQAFQLSDEMPPGYNREEEKKVNWYYIKLRPGLKEFLENVSKLYELHVYTMGTRAYAKAVAQIVDPQQKIFGGRILSRDESGSVTAKDLRRLFPVDTKMVVIIDDRGDVWQWSDNLIKVTPYDFFVGIGDINSSFLPKQEDFKHSSTAKKAVVPGINGSAMETEKPDTANSTEAGDNAVETVVPDGNISGNGLPTTDISALEQLVSMGGGDDPDVLQAQTSMQREALAAQLHDQPLLQKQKQLDEEDMAAEQNVENQNGDRKPSDPGKHRHSLLQDNDVELQHLERNLTEVHHAFFQEYDKALAGSQGGRVAELRGSKNAKKQPPKGQSDLSMNLQLVPDIKDIMPRMKQKVLGGVVLVFSGVIPLGLDIQSADIANWARSFGGRIFENVNRNTTHLIAGRNRTAKVRAAAKYPHIKIVTTQWLFDCISQWQRLNEEPYLVPIHPDDRGELGGSMYDPLGDDSAMLSSDADGISDEDENGLLDDDLDDPEGVSPIGPSDGLESWDVDWAETNKELDDWLGSDADDSDDSDLESNASGIIESGQNGRKRKRSGSPSIDGEKGSENGDDMTTGAEDLKGSRLAKRQQMARNRTTSLKEVATVVGKDSKPVGLPSPEATGEYDDVGLDNARTDGTFDDDALQKELEAELEADMWDSDAEGG